MVSVLLPTVIILPSFPCMSFQVFFPVLRFIFHYLLHLLTLTVFSFSAPCKEIFSGDKNKSLELSGIRFPLVQYACYKTLDKEFPCANFLSYMESIDMPEFKDTNMSVH